MTIPEDVLEEVMGDVERFRGEYPGTQVVLRTDVEGHQRLEFGRVNDLLDCALALVDSYVWERLGIALMADGLNLHLVYRPLAVPGEAETPIMSAVRTLWAEESGGGPQVMGIAEPWGEIGFPSPEEARRAADLVRGRFGIRKIAVDGQGVVLTFEEP